MNFLYKGLTDFINNLSQDRKSIKYLMRKKSCGTVYEIF